MNQLNPWHYNKAESTPDNPIYTHTFTILKYNKNPTIIGEFDLEKNTGRVSINVYDVYNSSFYSPFYNREYGNYTPIIQEIENIILKEMKRLGLKYVNDNNL